MATVDREFSCRRMEGVKEEAGRRWLRGHLFEGTESWDSPLQGCFDHLKCRFHYFHNHEAFKV